MSSAFEQGAVAIAVKEGEEDRRVENIPESRSKSNDWKTRDNSLSALFTDRKKEEEVVGSRPEEGAEAKAKKEAEGERRDVKVKTAL
jgi:hypothetical protein